MGEGAEQAFLADLAEGAFLVEWGRRGGLEAVWNLMQRYRALQIGLVGAVVIAVAKRLGARSIATLDLRHFGVVQIAGAPRLLPRDLRPEDLPQLRRGPQTPKSTLRRSRRRR